MLEIGQKVSRPLGGLNDATPRECDSLFRVSRQVPPRSLPHLLLLRLLLQEEETAQEGRQNKKAARSIRLPPLPPYRLICPAKCPRLLTEG